MRIAAVVEYDGSAFCGWQSQSHAPSVQDSVEEALSKVADTSISTVCAGRTDTGVHAYGQVVHWDCDVVRKDSEWLRGANANLPDTVALRYVKAVSDDFHARASAMRRFYRFIILNDAVASAILHKYCTHVVAPLDAKCMHDAAQHLIGEHDFSSFRGAGCQSRSPVRHVEQISVTSHNEGRFIYVDIWANAFLQHMVRNIAGVLTAVGSGEQPTEWVAEVLTQRDRTCGGVTLPGSGLYLVQVEYDSAFGFTPRCIVPQYH